MEAGTGEAVPEWTWISCNSSGTLQGVEAIPFAFQKQLSNEWNAKLLSDTRDPLHQHPSAKDTHCTEPVSRSLELTELAQ